jgi:hypothetical protein
VSRARNIKPGFFDNELLAECSPLARLLFIGLWCEADREGRLEDRPKRIKARCLPYDEAECETLLTELSDRNFIVRYSAEGSDYIAVSGFVKHQNPHQREVPSVIPAPHNEKHDLGSDKAQPRTEQAGNCTGSARLVTDSPIPLPDSRKKLPATPGAEAPTDPDPIFGNGLAFLVRKGVAEKGARGFLGAMRKEVRDDLAVIELLIEAERNDVCDPLAWLRAAGRKRARAGPQLASIGKTAQAIQALEDMKHGNRLGVGRDFNGDAKAPAALVGEHASG